MTLTISVIMFGFAKQVLRVRSPFILRGDCRVPFKQGTLHTSTPYQYLTKRSIKKNFFSRYTSIRTKRMKEETIASENWQQNY